MLQTAKFTCPEVGHLKIVKIPLVETIYPVIIVGSELKSAITVSVVATPEAVVETVVAQVPEAIADVPNADVPVAIVVLGEEESRDSHSHSIT